MEYRAKSSQIEKLRTSCVVCPVFSSKKMSPTALALDNVTGGYVSAIIKKESFLSKSAETKLLFPPEGGIERIILVGMGKEKDLDLAQFNKSISAAWRELSKTGAKDATFLLSDCINKHLSLDTIARNLVLAIEDLRYSYDVYKSKEPASASEKVKQITAHYSDRKNITTAEEGLKIGQIIANAQKCTKDLGNCPPNDCTPSTLADLAKSLDKNSNLIKTTVLEEKDMKALGMGALLSVTRGSTEKAKLICIEYIPPKSKSRKPIVFVGKGITFDTGGLDMKPRPTSLGMKFDMLGAATVYSLMKALVDLECPFPVVGVMACSENCVGPDATKPGSIVKTMKGITVEITNTDAEGRLVLCDALTYVERYQPDCVIDMATLTGGVIVALGDVASGLMSNHAGLQKEIELASQKTNDFVWTLPTWPIFKEKLVTKAADIRNENGLPSSVLAGAFLSHFTEEYPWAHLDIAGTAFTNDRQATGRPIHLLIEFLHKRMTSK